ncbi:hypothetical protein KL942_002147 [Ogataea angusta]|uniref:Mannosyltransferase n=1 Tax=Pichia angusta TaxID=870730 RepID=A0ABQ7RR73_PICAN|nr:hypothetical protein KL943_000819 [Ogataea angusta]KAG7841159.1 hypothetical protein KL942_002147 [Ogataea angusta]KAG7841266.1 hypothetical protein KL941_005363 [Ogataea angusta]KAG7846069.1 hypothetical protein KL940_004656 [Ogataea angusta]KAG7861043.1 hypothetical protein KL939_001610 [Ogataea angusta]
MYKKLDSMSIGANNSSSLGSALAKLWNNYKYLAISTLSVFLILNLLVSNSGSNPSFSLSQSYTQDVGSATHNATTIVSKPPRKNVKDMYTIEARLIANFPYNANENIEEQIWQLWNVRADDKNFPEECKPHIERWRTVNDNYNHNLITLSDAEDTVVDYLRPSVPEVVDALRFLPHDRLKYEFLKYLLVYIKGGLYADIDTTDIKPLKFWYDSKVIGARLMVGISADYNDQNWEKLYNRRLSFSNSIFRAKSHHPFLAKLIARITYICFTQQELVKSTNWDEVFDNVDANGEPLIQFTGPSIFTDTLFEYMNELNDAVFIRVAKNERDKDLKPIVGPKVPENQRFSYRSFSGAIAPTQVDDIIVMPHITFNGPENAQRDEYDDNDEKQGYEKYYYARSLSLTNWSNRKQKIQST